MKCRENEIRRKLGEKANMPKNNSDCLRKIKEKVKKEEIPSQGYLEEGRNKFQKKILLLNNNIQ